MRNTAPVMKSCSCEIWSKVWEIVKLSKLVAILRYSADYEIQNCEVTIMRHKVAIVSYEFTVMRNNRDS